MSNSNWIAVGVNGIFSSNPNGFFSYSSNGTSWSSVQPLNFANLTTVIASDGKGNWVSGGLNAVLNSTGEIESSQGVLAYSSDGKNWSSGQIINGFYGVSGVATDGNGNWVAVGVNGELLLGQSEGVVSYSSDGKNWSSAKQINGFSTITSVATDGKGNWVAVGSAVLNSTGGIESSQGVVSYSSDGKNWSSVQPLNEFSYITSVASDGKGNWVAVGISPFNTGTQTQGLFSNSSDGKNWSSAETLNGLNIVTGVASDGKGNWVAGGVIGKFDLGSDQAVITYSTDGKNWNTVFTLENSSIGYKGNIFIGGSTPIASDGEGNWVAVGYIGTRSNSETLILYSSDGINWTQENVENNNNKSVFLSVASSKAPPAISNICFPAGTPIKTDQGIIPIEQIDRKVNTINRQKILHITRTTTLDDYLISFKKSSIGYNVPSEKTIMTKDHKILFQGKLVEAYRFLDFSSDVKKVKYNGEVLYNVLLEEHGTMVINNITCETLHPNNIIAKLYYDEHDNEIIYEMNDALKERNFERYKKVVDKLTLL